MQPAVRLVILGKQGAGKGTQCVRLATHYRVPHISTGDMFRAAQRSGSDLADRLAKFMREGELIPDALVIDVVSDRLRRPDAAAGFILDGFPRTAAQAEGMSELLAPDDLDLCLDLEVDTAVVLARLSKRRVCERCNATYSLEGPPVVDWTCDACGGRVVQRDDDTEAAIWRRLELYERETAPLVAWYLERDKLVVVDGDGSPDTVTKRLVRAIDARLGNRF